MESTYKVSICFSFFLEDNCFNKKGMGIQIVIIIVKKIRQCLNYKSFGWDLIFNDIHVSKTQN